MTNIIIIGGGITGAFTAYLLAQKGSATTIITNEEVDIALVVPLR